MISTYVNPMDIEIHKPIIHLILPNKDKSRLVIELDTLITYIEAPKL
jgi:hypothetical protein